jgi:uncharacterized membrane protein HdeD (DUF308 family)
VIFVNRPGSLALRGTLAVLFGFTALLWPGLTIAALVLMFGTYALLDGIVTIVMGTGYRVREHSGVVLLEGLAGVGVGLAMLLWTRMAVDVVVMFVGVWALATGLLELLAALRLRREFTGAMPIAVAGGASVVLGVFALVRPSFGAIALISILGGYALVFGSSMLLHALNIRGRARRLSTPAEDHAAARLH